jgi:hypothetical protein
MVLKNELWHVLTLTVYSVVVVAVAMVASWSTALTLLVLCGIPLAVLMYERPLPLARLLLATALVSSVCVIIDAVGHSTGAWYSIVASSTRVLGVSFESLLFAVVHSLYFLVLYEYFFDDGAITPTQPNILLPVMATIGTLIVSFFYLFSVEIVSFSFLWIVAVLFAVTLLTLLFLTRTASVLIVQKVFWFAVAMWPLSLLMELVALANGVRIFAFTSEYLATVTLFQQVVPVEELVLLFVWPMVLAILYECYLDDAT